MNRKRASGVGLWWVGFGRSDWIRRTIVSERNDRSAPNSSPTHQRPNASTVQRINDPTVNDPMVNVCQDVPCGQKGRFPNPKYSILNFYLPFLHHEDPGVQAAHLDAADVANVEGDAAGGRYVLERTAEGAGFENEDDEPPAFR